MSVSRTSTMKEREDAWEVRTDAPEKKSAFYIHVGGPVPEVGAVVTWGHYDVEWTEASGSTVKVDKIDMDFDPDAPLH